MIRPQDSFDVQASARLQSDMPTTGTSERMRAADRRFRIANPSRISRPRGTNGVARRGTQCLGFGAALHAADAEIRAAVLGAHVELRSAWMGVRRSRIPISSDASRNGTALGRRCPQHYSGLWNELGGYPEPPEACLINFYGPDCKNGFAPGSGRGRLCRTGDLDLTRRFLPVSDRRSKTCRADARHSPQLGRCARSWRRVAACIPRRRPHLPGNIALAPGGRTDQSDFAPGDAQRARELQFSPSIEARHAQPLHLPLLSELPVLPP